MKTNRRITQWLALLVLAILNAQLCPVFAQGVTVFPVATNGAVTQYGGGLATDGTNYLFVFTSGGTNCAQLVSSNGALLGSQIILSGGAVGWPPPLLQVASGQTNYLVVWSDGTISNAVDIFGQFISWSGAKVGSKFPLLQSVGTNGFQAIEGLACDGTNFLVLWQDEAGVTGTNTALTFGQLVTPAGTLSGSKFQVASVGASELAQGVTCTFGRTNYLAIYQGGYYNGESLDGHYTTYGVFISPTGAVGSPFAISQTNSPDDNSPVVVAFDGTNFLATWDYNPGAPSVGPIDWRLHGRLVSPAGTFPGNEVALANESSVLSAAAFDGSNYLVGWGYHSDTTNTDKNIHFCFFDRSANAIGPVFTIFSPEGTNAPLIPMYGAIFDGKRFAISAILGTVAIGADGGIEGFPSAQVYGALLPASTAPPQFGVGATYSNKQFTLSLAGTPGINYAIQMATNLPATSWISLVTNSPTNGPFSFTDTGATNRSRFYRAVKQ